MAVSVGDPPTRAVATPVRFTFDDYVRYTEQHDGDFELRDGVIVAMAPEGDAHMLTRNTLDRYLHRTLDPARYSAFTESSFPCPGWAEGPRPDNFVARDALLDEGRRPVAADIALTIEIASIEIASDEARLKDDKSKTETYASVHVPEYWIVDLFHRNVLVHREPQGPNYTFIETKRPGETITAVTVDGLTIAVDLLLRHARLSSSS
jgi:Uma2 family endonuclease